MKITHNKVGQNLNLNDASKTEKAGDKVKATDIKNSASIVPEPSNSQATKVELSSRAQDVKRIKDLAMNAPDIDQAKVDHFQKLIDSGKYKVDAKAIANKMVDDHLMSESTSND